MDRSWEPSTVTLNTERISASTPTKEPPLLELSTPYTPSETLSDHSSLVRLQISGEENGECALVLRSSFWVPAFKQHVSTLVVSWVVASSSVSASPSRRLPVLPTYLRWHIHRTAASAQVSSTPSGTSAVSQARSSHTGPAIFPARRPGVSRYGSR